MRVFISYRRDDSAAEAGRLADALVQRLGSKGVFQDVAAIGAGRDFTDAIEGALENCDAVLVVVGPDWLAAGPSGQPRLSEPDDYVRLELATALTLDIPVVPVLVGRAEMPAPGQLPEDIRALANRQAVVLRDDAWHRDVDGLVASVRGESPIPVPRRRRLVVVAAALGAAIAVGGLGWALWGGGGSSDNGGSNLAICEDPSLPQFQPLDLIDQATGGIALDGGTLKVTVEGGGFRELAPGRWEVVLNTRMTNETPGDEYHADWRYAGIAVDGQAYVPTCTKPEVVLGPGFNSDGRIGFEVDRDPEGVVALLLSDGDQIDLTS